MKASPAKTIKSLILNNRLIIAAFLLPAILMILAFASMGVFPFGDEQIAVIDFYHQYLPLIEELQYKLHHGGSLFYTWNGAGGCNFWNVIAYQAASPFNILLILLPEKYLVEELTLFLLIRVGLAGSFMFLYLKKAYGKADFATVGFSTLYALCAYVIAYYWNIMWIDAVMLLPLCILGLRKVIDGGKPVLYVVSLAVIVFSNYYIGILVCIFIMTYYFALYFGCRREGGFKAFLLTSVRTALYSMLAVAMTGIILVPTWISMKRASAMKSTFPEDWYFYKDPLEIINQLFPFSKFSYMEGLPNICCGLIVVILLVFYFISRTIDFRGKLANAIYLTFIFFSMNVNFLDYIWHGLHFPNMLPFRYSFAVSFILVGMAYEAFLRINEVKVKHIYAVMAGLLAYYLIAQKLLGTVVTNKDNFFYIGVALLLLYTAVLVVYRNGLLKPRAFRYLFVILIAAELACVSITDVNVIGSTSKTDYNTNRYGIEKAANYISGDFDRAEIDDALTLNEPARFHYKGMTQFASSINSETNTLYEQIGLEAQPGSNRVKYVETVPILNAMLDIKYLIGKNRPVEDKTFKLKKEFGNTLLYETKYPMSIGYMAPNTVLSWDHGSSNPFNNLEDYARAISSNAYKDLFQEIECTGQSDENGRVTKESDNDYTVAPVDSGQAAHLILDYTSEKTQKYYAYVDASCAEYVTVKKDSDPLDIDIDENYGAIANIGTVKTGEKFSVDVEYEVGKSGTARVIICQMDEGKWEKVYEKMSQNLLDVTDFSDTGIKGRIDVKESGVLVTSIPYDDGWTMKVDGKEKEITDLTGGVWISTPLDPGTHEIELSFSPAGFCWGVLATILSIILLAGIALYGERVKAALMARRKSEDPEIDEPVNDISDIV